MKRRISFLEDENRSLKSQLQKKDKLLIEKDNQIKALTGQEESKMKFRAENDQPNRKIAEPTSKVSVAPVSKNDMLS